jgi:hypothetical protein
MVQERKSSMTRTAGGEDARTAKRHDTAPPRIELTLVSPNIYDLSPSSKMRAACISVAAKPSVKQS